MLCKPTSSYNEYKEGDNLNGNCPINQNILTTNVGKFLVFQQFLQDKTFQMKLEKERDQEKSRIIMSQLRRMNRRR